LARQLLEWRGEAESVGFCPQLKYVDEVLRRRAWSQGTVQQRLRPVRNDLRRIEIVLAAQPVALRAGAVHAVERERTRLQHRNVDAALRTGQLRRVQMLLAPDPGDLYQSVRQLHRQLNRRSQPVLDSRLHQQTVNHQLDGVVLALVQLDLVIC